MNQRRLVTALTVLVCMAAVATAQNHGMTRLNLSSGTNGRSVSFVTGQILVQESLRFPSSLPTVNQLLVVNTVNEADIVSQWQDPAGAGAVTTFVVKAANQDIATNPAYANVTDLTFPVIANRLYEFCAFLRCRRVGGGADMQIQFTVPAGTTMSYYFIRNNAVADDAGNFVETSDCNLPLPADPNVLTFEVRGTILTVGTPGNIQMRFRSSVNGQTVRMLANSYMRGTSLP